MDVSVLVAAEEGLKTETPIAKIIFWNVAILQESFTGENFHKLHGFGPIHKSLNLKIFLWVRQCIYCQWACHCRFPQIANV